MFINIFRNGAAIYCCLYLLPGFIHSKDLIIPKKIKKEGAS